MTIKEKISLATISKQVTLHKEGMFYKLYNQDAFYFTENIKLLKIQYKWFKNVNEYVFIVGFPVSYFDNLTEKLQELATDIDINEKRVKLVTNDDVDKVAYTNWKTKHAIVSAAVTTTPLLINKLLAFQVSNHTPMEAMLFLANLQKEAKIIEN